MPRGFTPIWKRLRRRHPEVREVVEELLHDLASLDSSPLGDQVTGVEGRSIYKIRLATGNRGRRAGARLLYLYDEHRVVALAVYAKNDRGNISPKELQDILSPFDEEDSSRCRPAATCSSSHATRPKSEARTPRQENQGPTTAQSLIVCAIAVLAAFGFRLLLFPGQSVLPLNRQRHPTRHWDAPTNRAG